MSHNENATKPASPLQHVAIIMDGNGRWAKKRLMPRAAGHKAGVKSVRKIIQASIKQNIKALTLFAFSSENWRRPDTEVSALMNLFTTSLKNEVVKLHENNVRLRIIGERSAFSPELQQQISDAEAMTAKNDGLNLVIAANYGGRWDITQATKAIAQKVADGELMVDDINPELVHQHVSLMADLPEPDLFIRTGGEHRISNFLLWQLSYTELYFTDTLWPDFNETEYQKAMDYFSSRQRRFGRTGEQVTGTA